MRDISKILSVLVDGKSMDFRLTKMDAFSGVFLLRLMARMPEGGTAADLLPALPEEDLRSLMASCLQHTEVLLPAGWMPVMTRGEWSFPELEHDTAVCLKLVIEEAVWTLEGFFAGGVSSCRKGAPGS